MADALSVIPPAVLRNLSDKLYEKRKNAALEVMHYVRGYACFYVCMYERAFFWKICRDFEILGSSVNQVLILSVV